MVPGSSFKNVILRPRLSKRFPIEADASPFPKEETTPPVTKMNLLIVQFLCFARMIRSPRAWLAGWHRPLNGNALRCRLGPLKLLRYLDRIFRCIHTKRVSFRFPHLNDHTMFQGAQLLQFLGIFQDTSWQRGKLQQCGPCIAVHTQMNIAETIRGAAAGSLTHHWNRRSRKV